MPSYLRKGKDSRECTVEWGNMRRLTPISRVFGFDRGQPIDRYYIDEFLKSYSTEIKGRVLEIGDSTYTDKYGGSKAVIAEVLHAVEGNPQATIIGDLGTGSGIPQNSFDCIILTQTLLCIYQVHEAIANTYLALKPGGVLLATFPGISQISRYDMDRWGDYWRFTTLSATKLFEEVFPPKNIEIKAYGNVLVAVAFLHGLAVEDLRKEEMDYNDPDYEVLIAVRAVKPKTGDEI